MEEVTIFKLFSIVSIWLIGFIGGLLPVVAARKQQHSPFVQHIRSVLNAFSGGVFLAGGFFHLLHAAIENPALQKWSSVDEGRYAFPYAEMFSTMGFLGLLLIEQAAHLQLHQSSKPSSSDVDEEDEEETGTEDYVEEVEDDIEAQSFVTRTKRQRTAHGHSHLVTGSTSSTVAMILFLALSFHSVLEGLGIGAQTTPAWGVFLAIILHKGLAAFALGSGMVQSSLPLTHVLVYMIVFSFMSIIGILVGWMIAADTTEDSAAAGICVALASGTFIYVAVMEVIPQEFPRHPPSSSSTTHARTMMHKITALCLGYALFGLLAKWS